MDQSSQKYKLAPLDLSCILLVQVYRKLVGCKDHFSHLQVLVKVLDHHDAVIVVISLLGYVVLDLQIQKCVEFDIDLP